MVKKEYLLDAFGRVPVSEPTTIFDSKQINDKAPLFWDDQQVSGGGTSSTYNTNQASTTIAVSANTIGKRVRQTFRRFNYQPGKAQKVKMTFPLETPKEGIKIKIGALDNRNGLFFYVHGTEYGFGIRSYTSGSAVDTLYPQHEWNVDTLNRDLEKNPTGVQFTDFKKCLFWFDYEWLGVGPTRFGFYIENIPVVCHIADTGTENGLVNFSTPNLPLRYEIENDGTGEAASLTHICSTVISEGGLQDTGYPFAIDRGATALSTGNNTSIYPLLGIRLKAGYLSSFIKILEFSITCTSTAAYNYMVIVNPTIVGTALTWSDVDNSSVQQMNTSTSATTVTGGTKIFSKTAQQTNDGSQGGTLASDFALGSTIAGVPDQVFLCVQRVTGTAESFFASLNLKDQQ
jgi:hypothetical protein